MHRPTWESLDVAQELPELVGAPLTVTDFVRYQGASNDQNPMHHDTEFATAAGYPGPFAVGMLQAGILGNFVADRFGPANVRRFAVRFREQAWPKDVITYRGVVVGKRESGRDRLVDLELFATRQTGGVHIEGWATVVV